METTLEKPLVLVADDGSGRVWVVNDGEGKSWYKAGADAGWVPFKEAKVIPLAQDLASTTSPRMIRVGTPNSHAGDAQGPLEVPVN